MKVQVVYTSLTGCTKKLANAIYENLGIDDKSIHDIKDGFPTLDGDIILAGYWGIGGGPCKEMQEFLATIKNKAVGIFCTLGYYAGSQHAFDTAKKGVELVKENNEVIGSYVCNGAVAKKLIKNDGLDYPHTPTMQKELRWDMIKNHPTAAECDLAAELFEERIELYKKCKELNIEFNSII